MKTFVFIDASNLFYGGQKSLGWKIDYQKLLIYLREKYKITETFYFGGVELHDFEYEYQNNDTVPIKKLEKHLVDFIKNKGKKLDEATLILVNRHLQRAKFYLKLEQFGYKLFLKPVKLYEQEGGMTRRKANCDVDMAFHLMKEKDNFDRVIILSGDGDFFARVKILTKTWERGYNFVQGPRTAREIRQFAGSNFRDFEYLKYLLKMPEK